MARRDAITVEGTVIEALPQTRVRVELENGHRLVARVPGRVRPGFEGLMAGDRVRVELSPYDLSRGCITVKI